MGSQPTSPVMISSSVMQSMHPCIDLAVADKSAGCCRIDGSFVGTTPISIDGALVPNRHTRSQLHRVWICNNNRRALRSPPQFKKGNTVRLQKTFESKAPVKSLSLRNNSRKLVRFFPIGTGPSICFGQAAKSAPVTSWQVQ